MKAVCPNNREHDRFITTAQVKQDWIVDENGNFIETSDNCSDILEHPTKYNIWICEECGVEANVED